jgi:hypothetical protein
MSRITIACDIDGVIAPVTADPDAAQCIELPRVMYGTHVLVRAIGALKKWDGLGARVLWHSAWREEYTRDLEFATCLPALEQFASEREFEHTPERDWWKTTAIRRWLHQAGDDEQLIWIDDSIPEVAQHGHIPSDLIDDPRLTVITPEPHEGLTVEQIESVTTRLQPQARLAAA